MKEKMTIEYSDSDFRQAIEEWFLSGNARYPSRAIEAAVRQALWLLWDTVEIQFFDYRYDITGSAKI